MSHVSELRLEVRSLEFKGLEMIFDCFPRLRCLALEADDDLAEDYLEHRDWLNDRYLHMGEVLRARGASLTTLSLVAQPTDVTMLRIGSLTKLTALRSLRMSCVLFITLDVENGGELAHTDCLVDILPHQLEELIVENVWEEEMNEPTTAQVAQVANDESFPRLHRIRLLGLNSFTDQLCIKGWTVESVTYSEMPWAGTAASKGARSQFSWLQHTQSVFKRSGLTGLHTSCSPRAEHW